ncbi:hypothetical protein N7495_002408 [Penicillium taxi]|uniref:uncharacterized protein n=1 Tax=Penicillium taxi TaxID=168475 RepID=UPI002544F66D|nr:uncharacterized protein N7495_002408 [Penicillium taxi]KAJ5901880.1 hypothetical protein N7495_002408 [Penicillium taxi]
MEDDHGSQGPVIVGICAAFSVLTFLVLCLRLFARIYVLGKMGVDDCKYLSFVHPARSFPDLYLTVLTIGACLLSWAFIGATISAVHDGLGQHFDYVDKNNLTSYSLMVYMSSIFYLACLGFIKTSVLWFYSRLGDRTLTRLSFIMIGVIVTQAASFVLVAAFQCQPISKAWKQSEPGKCININIFYLCNAALNILTDLMTYTLPVGILFKLQVPKKQKVILGVILCLGLFACVSSIIRITYIPNMLSSADYTYAISGAMYWSVIETNVGIFAASIPSFKAIASRFLPRFIGESSNKDKKSGPWSSKSDVRKNFTKFSNKEHITMQTMQRIDNTVVGTQIDAMNDSSSEERIIVPDGKIFAQTEIQTTFESHDEGALEPTYSSSRMF